MSEVRIRYHHEPEGWWADSPDMPGFSTAGETFGEVREMALEGVSFATDIQPEIVEEKLQVRIRAASRNLEPNLIPRRAADSR